VLQVIAEQLPADAAQRLLHRRDLRDDIGAVAILFHHFLQAAYLAFDTPQAPQVRDLEVRIDGNGFHILAPLNRKLLVTTLTELKAIAALARIGLSRMPNQG
jgi:hypothetical protein